MTRLLQTCRLLARRALRLVKPWTITGCRLRRLRRQLRGTSPPSIVSASTAPAGLAVVTYNRLDYLTKCVASLDAHQWAGATHRLIVDDGSTAAGYAEFLDRCRSNGVTVIQRPQNGGVGAAKNDALRHFMATGCEHLFLMEDDMLLASDRALDDYAAWGRRTGLQHLNFGLHGPANVGREQLLHRAGSWGLYYPRLFGAFSYFTRAVIEKVGYFDEAFYNAYEHLDHTYRIGQAGFTLPFWQFADHPLNSELLRAQPDTIRQSVIRRGDWHRLVDRARDHWIAKHGSWPPPRPS